MRAVQLRLIVFLLGWFFVVTSSVRGARFLFDNTKAETAGNADWVISEVNGVISRFPSPPASGITASTPETYWVGALSSWGVALVQRGHSVESLPVGTALTFGVSTNPQDLANYDVFVVCEPNILFTTAEKTAIVSWVQAGGALFMVSDHNGSDRNNDGADSPKIWNDLFTTNGVQADPFGLAVNLDSISVTTSDVDATPGNPLTRGPEGTVSQMKYSAGATITIHPAVNPSVRGVIWSTAAPVDNKVMCAYGSFGSGRFVIVGDSSPCDDGTGAPGNTLFFGWTEVNGDHARLFLNASAWLAAASAIPVVTVSATQPSAAEFGPVSGTYTITRASGSLAAALPVNFTTMSSTGASYGVEFTLSSGATGATIPAGFASVNVTLTPVDNPNPTPGSKTATLSLAGGSGYAVGAASSAQVFIAPEPLDAWTVAHFGADAANVGISGPTADPDADGIPNLLEYAFALDPVAPSPVSALPEPSSATGAAAIIFQVSKTAPDLQIDVETSADLQGWQSGAQYSVTAGGVLVRGGAGAANTTQVSAVDNGATIQVTESAGAPARFLRVRVTIIP